VGETIVSSIGGSAGWVLHSWLAFGASISLTAWGLLNLPIADERKVFLATSGLLLLTSTMNLVKVNTWLPQLRIRRAWWLTLLHHYISSCFATGCEGPHRRQEVVGASRRQATPAAPAGEGQGEGQGDG
jgi:hypothetical protein